MLLYKKTPTIAYRGPHQFMLRAMAGCLPLKAAGATIYLQEVVELGTVVYCIRQPQGQAGVQTSRYERSWGLDGSKVSDIAGETEGRS